MAVWRKIVALRGEPFLAKLSAAATYVVLPGAVIAGVVYSPPDFLSKSTNPPK